MKTFSKMPILSFLITGLSLGMFTNNASATTLPSDFAAVCSGNGDLYSNEVISSVIIMGAEDQRQAYIAVDGKIIATKEYSSDLPSDILLLQTAIEASKLGTLVDLCINDNTQQLSGINIRS